MKKAFAVLAFLLFAPMAMSQEVYSVTVGGTAANRNSLVGQLELGRSLHNMDICERGNLASTCTQAQACAALGVPGGAACTAAQALAADARIYPATLAGREAFIANELIRERAPDFLARRRELDWAAFKSWCATSTANRQSYCALASLSSDCACPQ